VIDEKGPTLLNRIHGDGCVTGTPADATEGLGLVGVSFGSDKFTIGRVTPKVSAAGTEEGASQGAERPDELAGIAALKSSPGKLQEKLLESFLRLRRVRGPRISGMGRQCAPFA